MQTELIKTYSKKDIEAEIAKFKVKYQSLPMVQQKIALTSCSKPELIDDCMIWKALETKDIIYNEIEVLRTPEISMSLTPKRLELLEYIATHSPDSIKNLAIQIKRNYKNVYDDIIALKKYNLLNVVREGKNIKPIARVDKIIIEIEK